jgi:hypothetical protein
MNVFQMAALRKIYGPIQGGRIWRNRYNFALYKLYKEPKLTSAIRNSKTKWGRSCVTYGRGTDVQQSPYAKISGERKVGSSVSRWFEEVNNDARELEIRMWWKRALVTEKWRKLVLEPKRTVPRKFHYCVRVLASRPPSEPY